MDFLSGDQYNTTVNPILFLPLFSLVLFYFLFIYLLGWRPFRFVFAENFLTCFFLGFIFFQINYSDIIEIQTISYANFFLRGFIYFLSMRVAVDGIFPSIIVFKTKTSMYYYVTPRNYSEFLSQLEEKTGVRYHT
jgi:hypothetical protein